MDSGPQPSGEVPKEGTTSEITSDALRYWEPRRLIYNVGMALVAALVMGWGFFAHGSFFFAARIWFWLLVFVFAVIANVFYSIVYPIELFVQKSEFQDLWRRYRWVLLGVGTLFAMILTCFVVLSMVIRVPPELIDQY